jgi:hypothetical protein
LGPLDGGPGPVEATVAVAQRAARGVRYVRQPQPFHPRCLAARIGRRRRRAGCVLGLWLVASLAATGLAWWTGTTPLVGWVIAAPGCYAAWLEATETRAVTHTERNSP